METINNILQYQLLKFGDFDLHVQALVNLLLIFIFTKIVLLFIKKAILSRISHKLDTGGSYALFKIIKYFVWVISIGLMLDSVGIELTVLLAGSAALLVGVGLGLQQTFNDILSGLILLSEKSIKIDDV
jgi:small-conductance mechanosensitive channel